MSLEWHQRAYLRLRIELFQAELPGQGSRPERPDRLERPERPERIPDPDDPELGPTVVEDNPGGGGVSQVVISENQVLVQPEQVKPFPL